MYLQSACRVEQDTDWSGHTRLVSPSDLSGHVRTEGWAQGPEYTLYKCPQKGVEHADVTHVWYVIASFPNPFETLEDGPGNEAGYEITKWHVSEMKAVSTQ